MQYYGLLWLLSNDVKMWIPKQEEKWAFLELQKALYLVLWMTELSTPPPWKALHNLQWNFWTTLFNINKQCQIPHSNHANNGSNQITWSSLDKPVPYNHDLALLLFKEV